MGGTPTNIDGEVVVDAESTPFPGLYAAGECACVSVHGANRLGTNSLLDIVVFGKRGGRAMGDYVDRVDHVPLPTDAADDTLQQVERLRGGSGSEKVAPIRAELQEEMTNEASVFRTDESLRSVLGTIHTLKSAYADVKIDDLGAQYNFDLTEAIELGYLLDLAEVLVVGARARTESRGAHFRDDHTERDDANWMKHTLAFRDHDGSVRIDYKPVVGGKYEPMERKY
jgi:succinate dehydrogenase / fumarate reductase flavoprotein subunit